MSPPFLASLIVFITFSYVVHIHSKHTCCLANESWLAVTMNDQNRKISEQYLIEIPLWRKSDKITDISKASLWETVAFPWPWLQMIASHSSWVKCKICKNLLQLTCWHNTFGANWPKCHQFEHGVLPSKSLQRLCLKVSKDNIHSIFCLKIILEYRISSLVSKFHSQNLESMFCLLPQSVKLSRGKGKVENKRRPWFQWRPSSQNS